MCDVFNKYVIINRLAMEHSLAWEPTYLYAVATLNRTIAV